MTKKNPKLKKVRWQFAQANQAPRTFGPSRCFIYDFSSSVESQATPGQVSTNGANLSGDGQAGQLVRNRSAFGVRGAFSLLRFFGQTKK